jgi:Sulfatase
MSKKQSISTLFLSILFIVLYRGQQINGFISVPSYVIAFVSISLISVVTLFIIRYFISSFHKNCVFLSLLLLMFFIVPTLFSYLRFLFAHLLSFSPYLYNIYIINNNFIKSVIFISIPILLYYIIKYLWSFDKRRLLHINNLFFIILLFNVTYQAIIWVSTLSKVGAHSLKTTNFLNNNFNLINSSKSISSDSLPDIYFILFDEYTGLNTLEDRFNHNNANLRSFLKEKGFNTPSVSEAHYGHTDYSLASMLNMNYLPDLDNMTEVERLYMCNNLIFNNNVVAFLKKMNYSVRNLSIFDMQKDSRELGTFYSNSFRVKVPTFLNFKHDVLLHYIIKSSIISSLKKNIGVKAIPTDNTDRYNRLLDIISSDMTNRKFPQFVYTHLLLPHQPFIYKSNGENFSNEELRNKSMNEIYPAQVDYTNSIMKSIVTSIQNHSKRSSIIILTGDHGVRYFTYGIKGCRPIDLYSIFQSVYFPNKEKINYPNNMALVNTFRIIFNTYLSTQLDLLPQKYFDYNSEKEIYPSTLEDDYFISDGLKLPNN